MKISENYSDVAGSMKSLYQVFDLALIFLACSNTGMASDLYKIIQAVKKSVPSGTQSNLRIAIIGGGYSGLACGHFCSKVAATVNIFGLEDSPGEQKGTSASTISVSFRRRGKFNPFNRTMRNSAKFTACFQFHDFSEIFW